MDGVWVALIGAVGVVIGALIKTFGPGALRLIRRKGTYGLTARWTGEWIKDWPTKRPQNLSDTITLVVNGKGEVVGDGAIPDMGEYKIVGRDSKFCATLLFFGVQHPDSLAGTILLQKGVNPDLLKGVWSQLTFDDQLIGGRVTLKRLY